MLFRLPELSRGNLHVGLHPHKFWEGTRACDQRASPERCTTQKRQLFEFQQVGVFMYHYLLSRGDRI